MNETTRRVREQWHEAMRLGDPLPELWELDPGTEVDFRVVVVAVAPPLEVEVAVLTQGRKTMIFRVPDYAVYKLAD